MLSYEGALAIARQHLYSMHPPPSRVWVLRHGKRVKSGWLFASAHEPLRFIDDGKRFAGGESGFMVDDSGELHSLGLLTYLEYEQEAKELAEASQSGPSIQPPGS